MRKRTVALIVVAAVLLALVGGAYWAGRHLFYEPTARGVDSVIGELGGTRVLGVFAHPDDEQTVNGLFFRAKQRRRRLHRDDHRDAGRGRPPDARSSPARRTSATSARPRP